MLYCLTGIYIVLLAANRMLLHEIISWMSYLICLEYQLSDYSLKITAGRFGERDVYQSKCDMIASSIWLINVMTGQFNQCVTKSRINSNILSRYNLYSTSTKVEVGAASIGLWWEIPDALEPERPAQHPVRAVSEETEGQRRSQESHLLRTAWSETFRQRTG